MRTWFFGLAMFALASIASATDLKPTAAAYSVSRSGATLGEASFDLTRNGDGTWTLRSVTKGTQGIALMVGLDMHEESIFRLQDGKLEGLRYDSMQQTLKRKERHVVFDWKSGQAQVNDNGKNASYAIGAGTMDRSIVAIALGQALAAGRRDVTLAVAGRDGVEQQHYVAKDLAPLHVPAGDFKAIEMRRVDGSGAGSSSWFAPAVSMLPLRVEQVQKDGSTIVLELKSH